MNVRFDTWMKRANLCVREPLYSLKLAVTQVHMVHIYYPDGSMATTRVAAAAAVCTKERCIEHLPLCCGESVSITHAAAPF